MATDELDSKLKAASVQGRARPTPALSTVLGGCCEPRHGRGMRDTSCDGQSPASEAQLHSWAVRAQKGMARFGPHAL
jgi:hypothetical protein